MPRVRILNKHVQKAYYNISSASNLSQNFYEHNLGYMNIECIHCGALYWIDEYITSSSQNNHKFAKCCSYVSTKSFASTFEDQDEHSKEFCYNIHQYNAAYAFTLLGTNIDKTVLYNCGLYSFHINGELYHLTGSFLSKVNTNASYV
ncbi:7622_t:CDS:2 [Dentiscutata heterogama]|uniref:7622_t:CDS:1 n=1 Tax=Dentiscutata heterogama TaxID=1316150 RepID=A0ACA9N4U9_9GLOM|nr:7622_t:CDS:2 [Dentiscutata heterogama]